MKVQLSDLFSQINSMTHMQLGDAQLILFKVILKKRWLYLFVQGVCVCEYVYGHSPTQVVSIYSILVEGGFRFGKLQC